MFSFVLLLPSFLGSFVPAVLSLPPTPLNGHVASTPPTPRGTKVHVRSPGAGVKYIKQVNDVGRRENAVVML